MANWKAISIINIFDLFSPGKGKGLNHLPQTIHGISYIGATNRNNGVLCFVENNNKIKKLIQRGNCIGFIKNGDGSAGFAIYKKEDFISTSDVIFGYAEWINVNTGLFFVCAQDMIKDKYSHGYKRNQQHLKGDKVMLPVSAKDKPDYEYMGNYTEEKKSKLLKKYKEYLHKRLIPLGEIQTLPALNEKEWQPFDLTYIFDSIIRGKRLKKADHCEGTTPYVSSTATTNGNDGTCGNTRGVRKFSNCLTIANSGSVGSCFYHPYEFVASDHVTALIKDGASEPLYLGLSLLAGRIGEKYNFNREINDARISRERIMLPGDDEGNPDYDYIEQYAKNMMIKKYRQYLAYLESRKTE